MNITDEEQRQKLIDLCNQALVIIDRMCDKLKTEKRNADKQ